MKDKLPLIHSPVLERSRLSYSPDLLTQLDKANINLSLQDPQDLEGFIEGTPGFKDKAFQSNCSTTEDPHVIFENGASLCSLLVAADKQGNVLSLHVAIVWEDLFDTWQLLKDSGFIQQLKEKISADRTIFITATGVLTTAADRLELVKHLELIFGQPVNYLFLSDPQSRKERATPWSTMRELIHNLFCGKIDENRRLQFISNIFIVPSACSSTGKTEIIIPKYVSGQFNVLTSAISAIKNKLMQNRLKHAE
jgi:hypothetical protein